MLRKGALLGEGVEGVEEGSEGVCITASYLLVRARNALRKIFREKRSEKRRKKARYKNCHEGKEKCRRRAKEGRDTYRSFCSCP